MIVTKPKKSKTEEISELNNCVDVRVVNVDPGEIDNLNALLDAMGSADEYAENVTDAGPGQNYVVTVKTGELRELKDALRLVLQVVQPDRVEIEPWDGFMHS